LVSAQEKLHFFSCKNTYATKSAQTAKVHSLPNLIYLVSPKGAQIDIAYVQLQKCFGDKLTLRCFTLTTY